MVNAARKLSPDINFQTGDLLNIALPSAHLGSAIAFYSIVHFTHDQIRLCFTEINRVLKAGGQFFFSYHAGEETVHFDKAHDKDVDIDLYFFKTNDIIGILKETGFKVIEAIERRPHEEAKFQSTRAYIWAKKDK